MRRSCSGVVMHCDDAGALQSSEYAAGSTIRVHAPVVRQLSFSTGVRTSGSQSSGVGDGIVGDGRPR